MSADDRRNWEGACRRMMAKMLTDLEKLKVEIEEWYAAKPVQASKPLTADDDPEYLKIMVAIRDMRKTIAEEGWDPADYPTEEPTDDDGE